MYFIIVVLFLLVCPAASVVIQAAQGHHSFDDPVLIARWWTFWAVGIRLFIAGIRQVIQPRFTAEEIFRIREPNVFPLVREIGFANLSMGAIGICSLVRIGWVIPAAVAGGLYYGFAALGHITQKNKNVKEYTAMVSDVFACLMLLTFTVRISA
jgi:hypothetical protein